MSGNGNCGVSAVNPLIGQTYDYDPLFNTNSNFFTGAIQTNGCSNGVAVLYKTMGISITSPGFQTYNCYYTGQNQAATTFDVTGPSRALLFTCPVPVGSMVPATNGQSNLWTITVTSLPLHVYNNYIVFGARRTPNARSSTAYTQKRGRPDSDMWLQQASRSEVVAQIEARAEAEKRKASTKSASAAHRKREVSIKGRMGGWATLDKLD